MSKYNITAYECEHTGDLNAYATAVRQAGGTILSQRVNEDAETGFMQVEADDNFLQRLKQVKAFGEPASEWMSVRKVQS